MKKKAEENKGKKPKIKKGKPPGQLLARNFGPKLFGGGTKQMSGRVVGTSREGARGDR